MIVRYVKEIVFLFSLLIFFKAYAANLFVTPISQYVLSSTSANITFLNSGNNVGYLQYTPGCIINNQKLSGDDCKKYFDFNLTDMYENELTGVIGIPPNKQIDKEVVLKYKPVGNEPFYAIFNPLFTVIDASSTRKKDSVSFQFRFSPGALFVYNPKKDELSLTSFTTNFDQKKVRSVRFEFDLNKLKYPQVVSVNAKIIDKKTKKIIRFIDLSKDRIVDPSRKTLELSESIDTEKGDASSLCYELYIIENLTKSFYKINSKC
ncbi:MAG: hypothetical protein V4591_00125 [Bdellovibrionota bacterium]